MLFRNRKDFHKAFETEVGQVLLDQFEQLRNKMDAAKACTNPADRFLQLEDIKSSIEALEQTTRRKINNEAQRKFDASFFGVTTGTAIISAGLILLGLSPALMVLPFVAIPVGGVIGG